MAGTRKSPHSHESQTTVLILCTGNSTRSQIAEGITRAAAGDLREVQSAGSNPAGYVHPKAVRVLREIGIEEDQTVLVAR